MALPNGADIIAIADQAEAKSDFTSIVDFIAGLTGGKPIAELTIASGSVTASSTRSGDDSVTALPHVTIDTESDAASDTLANIDVTAFEDGQFILVGLENANRVVTMSHEAGGAGQLSFIDSRDLVLFKTTQWVLFYVDKSATAILRERARFGFDNAHDDAQDKTGNYPILDREDGRTFTNDGAGGTITLTLPTPRTGLRFTVFLKAAQQVNVVPGGSENVYLNGTASTSGWWADAVGEFIVLEGVDSATWNVIGYAGTWTAV